MTPSDITIVNRRLDPAESHDQSAVEIIHRWANVARQQIERISHRGPGRRFRLHRQMLFTRRERRKFRMSDDHAGWNAGIGGNGLMSGIARDEARVRMAYHPAHNQRRRNVAVFAGKLRAAGRVAIHNRPG